MYMFTGARSVKAPEHGYGVAHEARGLHDPGTLSNSIAPIRGNLIGGAEHALVTPGDMNIPPA